MENCAAFHDEVANRKPLRYDPRITMLKFWLFAIPLTAFAAVLFWYCV